MFCRARSLRKRVKFYCLPHAFWVFSSNRPDIHHKSFCHLVGCWSGFNIALLLSFYEFFNIRCSLFHQQELPSFLLLIIYYLIIRCHIGLRYRQSVLPLMFLSSFPLPIFSLILLVLDRGHITFCFIRPDGIQIIGF